MQQTKQHISSIKSLLKALSSTNMPLTQPPAPTLRPRCAAEETVKVDGAVILAIKHMSSSPSGQGTEVAKGDSCCSTLLCDGWINVMRVCMCVCVRSWGDQIRGRQERGQSLTVQGLFKCEPVKHGLQWQPHWTPGELLLPLPWSRLQWLSSLQKATRKDTDTDV